MKYKDFPPKHFKTFFHIQVIFIDKVNDLIPKLTIIKFI